MGQEHSSGVVKEGTSVIKVCTKCGQKFETKEGTITIKGPSPPHTKCKPCEAEEFKSMVARMRDIE